MRWSHSYRAREPISSRPEPHSADSTCTGWTGGGILLARDPGMKCLYTTSDRTLAHLLRSALESEGIPSIVQAEHLTPLLGEVPTGASAEYRVCIVDGEQSPRGACLGA